MGYVRTGDNLPDVCAQCHFPLRPEFNYCPSCGARLKDVCGVCRAPLETGWAYCAACGAARGGESLALVAEDERLPTLEQQAERHNTRGSELYENDEYEEAIREFSAAVSLAPENSLYHTNLAVALSERGDYDRAVSEFQEAIGLDPSNVSAYLQLGYTYQEMEKPLQAVEAWRKVLEIAPGTAEAEEAQQALDSI